MEKPRISLCLSSRRYGGGERHVEDLLNHLRQDFDFELVLPPDSMLEKRVNVRVHHFDFSHFPNPLNLYRLLKILQPASLVHAHLNRACLYTSLLNPFKKFKLLQTIHGFASPMYFIGSDRLVSVSRAIHEDLPSSIQSRSRIVYNGIPHAEIIKKAPSIPLQGFILATIHPNKGQVFCARSISNLSLPLHITCVGQGNPKHEQELQALVGPHLSFIPQTLDLSPFWQEADFILIPSYKEALSYVALEALARGIPVVASSTGGLIEIIEDGVNGLLFEPGNQASLVQALQRLLSLQSVLRQNLSQRPFLEFRPEFNLQPMLNKIREMYQQALTPSKEV